MAKEYLEKLCELVSVSGIEQESSNTIEVKHFFSGAALYADGKICASWSPAGLAFKLPEHTVSELLEAGKAKPLKYFDKGRIKKEYALFDDPDVREITKWRNYLLVAIHLHG